MRQNLGQHFLKNSAVLKKIAESLKINSGETIIEIGPGHGELTEYLAESGERRAKGGLRIITIERDLELAELMRHKFKNSVEVLEGNVLQVLPALSSQLSASSYKLCGNIPYYLTGYLLRTISELEHKPVLTVLTIQKEVAERIAAKPPQMNRLAAAVQFWAKPKIIGFISRNDFEPPPEVDSATIRLIVPADKISKAETDAYYRILAAVFKQPRKTIENNLMSAFKKPRVEVKSMLLALNIDSNIRPQELRVEDIQSIARSLSVLQ